MKNGFRRKVIELIEEDRGYTQSQKSSYGYCKIEIRGDKCRINISINGLRKLYDSVYKANLIKVRENDLKIVPIGVIEIDDNYNGNLKITTKSNNIMESNYTIDEFDLIAISEKKMNNNQLIVPLIGYIDVVLPWKMKISSSHHSNMSKENIVSDDADIMMEREGHNNINKAVDREDQNKNVNNEDIAKEENIDLKGVEEKKQKVKKNNQEDKINNYYDQLKVENNFYENKFTNDVRKEPIEIENIENQTFEIIKNQFDNQELKEFYRNIFTQYPKMTPFENRMLDNDWVRIEPSDIIYLPIHTWMLTNNTFLLNAYKKYKHLLLGRERSIIDDEYKFILGVPGIYYQKDKMVAYLYGFKDFICCRDTRNKPGEYGYWIYKINYTM